MKILNNKQNNKNLKNRLKNLKKYIKMARIKLIKQLNKVLYNKKIQKYKNSKKNVNNNL